VGAVLAAIGDLIGVVTGEAVGTETGVDVVATGDFECTIGAVEVGAKIAVGESGKATDTVDGEVVK
jgi:hypothetical protein